MGLPGRSQLILLVDDVEDALDIYSTYLSIHGYRVVTATNGREALVAAAAERPALILLDLRMPVMDGTSTLRELRQSPSLQGVPVVALTAHALREERDAAARAGFDYFVTKPCLPDELLALVVRIIGSAT